MAAVRSTAAVKRIVFFMTLIINLQKIISKGSKIISLKCILFKEIN